jgi:glycosyltransferase involved in cell wall biosynthesis
VIRISVVIPTLNRPGPLAACLKALEVSFPADAETIVVSDGGSKDLGTVVAPFVKSLRLRLVRIENSGPGAARNRGIELARGQIVAFTDDDCRPHPGWLAALAAGVRLSPPHAVGGATHNGLPENAYADAAQLVLFLLAAHDRARSGRERFLPSNNFAFPAQALIRVGGFDPRFRTAEDRDLCRRWAQAGFTLGRVSKAVVDHDQSLNLKTFTGKFCAYGRGAAKFHDSGPGPSLRESLGFHFRLPALALPELRRRGVLRGTAMLGLLVLWEIANLAGFIAERLHRLGKREGAGTSTETATPAGVR